MASPTKHQLANLLHFFLTTDASYKELAKLTNINISTVYDILSKRTHITFFDSISEEEYQSRLFVRNFSPIK